MQVDSQPKRLTFTGGRVVLSNVVSRASSSMPMLVPLSKRSIACASRFGVQVMMVASYAHRIAPTEGVQIIQVDASDQAADLYIANHMMRGDIIITQDFGVAALALAKGAIALSFRGQQYTEDNIDYLLASRHERSGRDAAVRGPRDRVR